MAIGARAIIAEDVVGKRDMTTIRGVDTQERIFYISPYWMKELLIRNVGTNDVQIRLSEREKPITVKAGGELNLSGEFAYFLASASATQNIEILYRSGRKLIAKGVPPVALYFDGKDDFVKVLNSQSLNCNHITMSAWIKSYLPLRNSAIFEKGYMSQYFFQLYFTGTMYVIRPHIWWTDGTFTANTGSIALDMQWRYVVGTYDGSKMQNYVDAVAGASIAVSKQPVQTEGDLYIGIRGNAASVPFAGFIVPQIYNRALSDREVKHNYNNPHEPIRKCLVLYLSPYSIDIVNGKWYDLSGQENHGTIYGATLKELWRPEQ